MAKSENQKRISQGLKFSWERRKTVKEYVIRCGNHWLQTDDHLTKPEWTHLAQATLHTKKWAEDFAKSQLKLNTRVEVILATKAIEDEREAGLQKVRSRWNSAFEDLVRQTFIGYTTDGLWVNCHMYFSMGITVPDAVERFGKSLKLQRRLA